MLEHIRKMTTRSRILCAVLLLCFTCAAATVALQALHPQDARAECITPDC